MSRIYSFALAVWLVSTAWAAEERRPVSSDDPESRLRTIQQVDDGYVFVNGTYLPPPYHIGESEQGLTINGRLITARMPSRSDPSRSDWDHSDWDRGNSDGQRARRSEAAASMNMKSESPKRNGFSHAPSSQSRLAHRLRDNSILFVFENDPAQPSQLEPSQNEQGQNDQGQNEQGQTVIIAPRQVIQFLRVITNLDFQSEAYRTLIDSLSDSEDRRLVARWLKTYNPSADLLERANSVIAAHEAIDSANRAQNLAVRRIDRFSYPITVLGMVLAVLSSGHLLSSRPADGVEGISASCQSKVLRAATISVAFVVFFSALDLAWTILAAQAGQMRELNPIGIKLIQDPVQLIAFKSVATLTSCGILLALRHYHIARLASWWSCLACTILAFRWLTFNSLFLGS